MTTRKFKNPKQGKSQGATGPAISGYNYYAGYSLPFVQSVFDYFGLQAGACILDPWNGSGTTTRVAKSRGINSIGFDLNPATLVIARAGLIDWNTIAGSVQPLSEHLLERAKKTLAAQSASFVKREEPFNQWFSEETSFILRNLELTVRATLVGLSSAQTTQFSPLAAFFYLALFRLARDLTKPFGGSNPTWIKTAKSPEECLKISPEDVYQAFERSVRELSKAFAEWEVDQRGEIITDLKPRVHSEVRLDVADSRNLPLPDKSVDAVVTSPPYCTRIDYVVAMLPELAVIGLHLSESESLKRQLLGTTTVPSTSPRRRKVWGKTCGKLLSDIENHPSRASKTYYLKWATQYFDSLSQSLREIDRVLKPDSFCAIVLQSSYYKEIKIDLPEIVYEMASAMKWKFGEQSSFTGKSTMVSVNPRAKVYRDPTNAEESVLVFKTSK
jgi:SAM-dependent methyltransferase